MSDLIQDLIYQQRERIMLKEFIKYLVDRRLMLEGWNADNIIREFSKRNYDKVPF